MTRTPTSRETLHRWRHVPDHRRAGDVGLVFSEMIHTGARRARPKDEAKEQAAKSGNPPSRFIKAIADIFVPLLPALSPANLRWRFIITSRPISSLRPSSRRTTPLVPTDSSTVLMASPDYDDVNLVSSAAFAFLPVLVGFSAVKTLRWQRLPGWQP